MDKGPVARARYSHSDKVKAVTMAVDQGIGAEATAIKLNIPQKTLASWIRAYKAQGAAYKNGPTEKKVTKVKTKLKSHKSLNPIVVLRLKKNISQQELGDLLGGIHNSTIGRYEKGITPLPPLVRRELNRMMCAEGLPEIPEDKPEK